VGEGHNLEDSVLESIRGGDDFSPKTPKPKRIVNRIYQRIMKLSKELRDAKNPNNNSDPQEEIKEEPTKSTALKL
jgi:hypothetical protein